MVTTRIRARLIGSNVVTGLIASLCCGGSNYFVYRHLATCGESASDRDLLKLRRGMFGGATLGVAVMAVSFVVLEWLNHAVVHGERFLTHTRYGAALIPGVPNSSLLYAVASFSVLALLWAMPFPRPTLEGARAGGPVPRMLRIGVMLAALALLFVLVADAIPRVGHVGSGNGQQGTGHGSHH